MAKALVLSINGGGMKGIVPVTILAAIEKALGKQSINVFTHMGGTSTGAIIVSLLSVNQSPPLISEFFKQDGPQIFPSGFLNFGLFGPKYSAATIESLLKANLHDITLKTGRAQLLIPAFNLATNESFFFRSWEGPDYPLWKAARASSAAQLYFPAFQDGKDVFIDGGNSNNNPALVLYSDLVKQGYADEDIKILSLGCGQQPSPVKPADSYVSTNAIRVLNMTLAVLLESGVEDTDYVLQQILGKNYFVANPPMNKTFALDDASLSVLNDQENQTNAWLEENLEEILDFIKS